MIDELAVVMPARNEQAMIARAIEALLAAAEHAVATLDSPPRIRVVVVLDGCTDGTAGVVASYPEVEAVTREATDGVGPSRRAGAEHVIATSVVPLAALWLASTDADSRVPRDWISRMIELARTGAEVVLGTVIPDEEASHDVRHAWRRQHLLRDGHRFVHGANFGIRADSYLALGGWPELASGEDVELARLAAERAHMAIVRTAAIPVLTSARLSGRAPRGFAAYLVKLTAALGEPADLR